MGGVVKPQFFRLKTLSFQKRPLRKRYKALLWVWQWEGQGEKMDAKYRVNIGLAGI